VCFELEGFLWGGLKDTKSVDEYTNFEIRRKKNKKLLHKKVT
jgi:hypothetical protein